MAACDGFRRHDGRGLRGAALAFGLERRQPLAVALHDGFQLCCDARDNVGPVLALFLAEQPHGRIPGIVLAIEQPAPVGHPRQQHPDRLAQRAGDMRNRRVDGDDEVERADGGGGIDKVLERRREILDRRFAFQFFQIGRARAVLQARERRARDGKERSEHRQIERTAGVVDMIRVARPDDADPQAFHFCKPRVPALLRLRRRAQIGNLSRNGFEPRLENARQA